MKKALSVLENASRWIGLVANSITALAVVFRKFGEQNDVEREVQTAIESGEEK